jgi:AcrR family transcriptional regulator
MPKISDDRRTDRRRQIIEAAQNCFMRNGFEATSMADIITESGMSAGSLYAYFENKVDIVRHVASEVVTERAADAAAIAARDPLPDPSQLVAEYLTRLRSGAGSEIRIHTWSACLRDPELRSVFAEFAEQFARLHETYMRVWLEQQGLDAETAAQRAAPLVQVLRGICLGAVIQLALDPNADPDTYLAGVRCLDFGTTPEQDGP